MHALMDLLYLIPLGSFWHLVKRLLHNKCSVNVAYPVMASVSWLVLLAEAQLIDSGSHGPFSPLKSVECAQQGFQFRKPFSRIIASDCPKPHEACLTGVLISNFREGGV